MTDNKDKWIKTVCDLKHKQLNKIISSIEKRLWRIELAMWGTLASVVFLLLSKVAIALGS